MMGRRLSRPRIVSLGSTGYMSEIRWRGWNSRLAVGQGYAYAMSSVGSGRDGPATVLL